MPQNQNLPIFYRQAGKHYEIGWLVENMLAKLRKLLFILGLQRPLGANAILNVSSAAKVRARCISRPAANQLWFSRQTAPLCARSRKPPLSPAQLKSIGSLTSSPASSHHLFPFGPPPSSTLFHQAAPHPFLQESYLFHPQTVHLGTTLTAIIFEQESCSFDGLDQPHSQSLSSVTFRY